MQTLNHIIWLQNNGRNLADRARHNLDAFFASKDTYFKIRAINDQEASAKQYLEARQAKSGGSNHGE